MANSTTNIDTVVQSQASKEVTINAALDAASQALTYGRRASTSSGLTWGYYGGNVVKTDGTMAQIANGTLTLTASNTNYIVAAKATGAVSVSTANTNWLNQTDYWRLYSVVAGAATVTSYTDSRDFMQRPAVSGSETTTTLGALINGATAKTTPIDADMIGLMDSAASNILKKLSWANIKATLKTYFDTLYQAASVTLTTWAGITPGTGVGTALAVNVGSAGAVVTNGGALGTPSGGTLTNCTGLPIAGGGTGQTTAQAAINALTAASAATNEYVLTKDTATGNAIFKAAVGGSGSGDFKADGSVPMTGDLQMGTNDITFTGKTMAFTSGIFSGLRNKIVNGCGWIDQININAAVTVNSTNNTFGPDKWCGSGQLAAGVFTLTGSKTVCYPAGKGMPSSISTVTTTADTSPAATAVYILRHAIQGDFCADWRLGTATAATVKLRFAAKSSLIGTHCVALMNSANNRSYVATYTISAADTWEEKEITVALDTTGTWLATNGAGLKLFWNLGCGANYETTANTWAAGAYYAVAGCAKPIATLNATLYITDVDMRLASDSAIYEFRDPQKELELCQLEVWKSFPQSVAPAQNAGTVGAQPAFNDGLSSNGYLQTSIDFQATMRATPTEVTVYNPSAANANFSSGEAVSVGSISSDRFLYLFSTNTTASTYGVIHVVAKARL